MQSNYKSKSLRICIMDLVSRLKHYLDSRQISVTQFADECAIPRPTGSQLLAGRNKKVSDEIISKIHTAYPDLNIVWLMFGEGNMVTNANIEISEPQNEPKNEIFAEEHPTDQPIDFSLDFNESHYFGQHFHICKPCRTGFSKRGGRVAHPTGERAGGARFHHSHNGERQTRHRYSCILRRLHLRIIYPGPEPRTSIHEVIPSHHTHVQSELLKHSCPTIKNYPVKASKQIPKDYQGHCPSGFQLRRDSGLLAVCKILSNFASRFMTDRTKANSKPSP